MSVASLANTRGSTVTFKRKVMTTATAGGSRTVASYTTIATGAKVVIQIDSAEHALRLHGLEGPQVASGYVAYREDIALDDRVQVTAGFQSGKLYRIANLKPMKMGPRSHVELGMEEVDE